MLFISLLGSNALRAEEKAVQAIYQKGVWYTGSTTYVFKEVKTGSYLDIVDAHEEFRAKNTPRVTVPRNLLADVKNDAPETNPTMVGKVFTIAISLTEAWTFQVRGHSQKRDFRFIWARMPMFFQIPVNFRRDRARSRPSRHAHLRRTIDPRRDGFSEKQSRPGSNVAVPDRRRPAPVARAADQAGGCAARPERNATATRKVTIVPKQIHHGNSMIGSQTGGV
jgi:hypothetical protein